MFVFIRQHQKNLTPLLLKVLKDSGFLKIKSQNTDSKKIENILSREKELLEYFKKHILNIKKPPIDLIAVTNGPGLEPALWVGISFAKALGGLWSIPYCINRRA